MLTPFSTHWITHFGHIWTHSSPIFFSSASQYVQMFFSRKVSLEVFILTSLSGNIFRVTGPLWWEFTGHKGQWRRALMFSVICAWSNGWANNRDAGDLRGHRAHYDVNVMSRVHQGQHSWLARETQTTTIKTGPYFANISHFVMTSCHDNIIVH